MRHYFSFACAESGVERAWLIRFTELFGGQQAVDRVRGQNMPKVGPTLDYLGACPPSFFSYNTHVLLWSHRGSLHHRKLDRAYFPSRSRSCNSDRVLCAQVRIYQVKKEDPLGRDLKSANAFAQGKKRKRTKPPVRRKAAA